MPTYCTDARLTEELLDDLPTELSTSYRSTQITDASSEIDALVGSLFTLDYSSSTQKFPNATDSPATPIIIQKACIWLAASYCWTKQFSTSRMSTENTDPAARYRELVTNADETGLIDKIRSGELSVILSDGVVLGRSVEPFDGGINYSEKNVNPPTSIGRYSKDGTLLDPVEGVLDGF